jgi:putative nucleotidyltransferase with HDIG domain
MDGHRLTKEFFVSTAPVLADEGFTCFYAVPLISKGKIKGVLEVFEREHLHHDRGWVDFLNSLAGQAAIAIDNVSLFNDLQRSNADLSLAYESTLEGWSAALDLRDRDTEGHTQRVTKLTEQIAISMGITGKELLSIRRGALLHDIGKVGVPDRILHKRGPLTTYEWKIMRKHPQFAYDMLSPIGYLHDALDIPFSHHEKWDGSGYPRGLKGEEIPLAARIFAVVDVYDALTSNRPYRAGWSRRKTLKYIRDQAWIHFDPQIVELFMRQMETK